MRRKLVVLALVVMVLSLAPLLSISSQQPTVSIWDNSDVLQTTTQNETCEEYLERRLSEGWEIIEQDGYNVTILSPEGIRRELDMRNDIETLRPNAAGDEESIDSVYGDGVGTHYTVVDEETPDDGSSYVMTNSTTYQRDLYNLPVPSGSGTINFIKIYIRCFFTEVNVCYGKPSLKSDTTVTDGTAVTWGPTYQTTSQQWDNNPADGQPWEWSDIDSLQIGVALKGNGTLYRSYCTQVYVEVDYTPQQPYPPTSLLCEGETNPTQITDTTPEFSAVGTDSQGDQMNYYALQVDNDSGFGTPIYNKTKTSITAFDNGARCSDVSYENSDLVRGITYYWRIKFWDNNANEGDWSTETATFKINVAPNSPTSLLCEGETNPTHVVDFTPEFSAVFTDNDAGDNAENAQIRVGISPIYSIQENQDAESGIYYVYSGGITRLGQVRVLENLSVKELSFYLMKESTPSGDITFTVRKVSDDSLIVSKVWGDASLLSDISPAWCEVEFDNCPLINENVRILVEYSGAYTIYVYYKPTDVKSGEWLCAYDGSWTDYTTNDTTYRILLEDNTLVDNSLWSSSWIDIPTCENNARCSEIPYAGGALSRGTTYYWQIRFMDVTGGTGAWSEADTFKINQLPTVPTNINDLGMNLTDHTPNKTFTKGTDADGDTVYTVAFLGTSANPTEEDVRGTGTTLTLGENTFHSTYPLIDGQTYYVRLRSWDGYEWSSYTSDDQFRMNTPPSEPTSWTDLGMNLIDHTPTITWTEGIDAEGDTVTTYIYLGTTSTPTEVDASTTDETDDLGENASHSTYPLTDGSTYYYRLRSWDGYEYSAYTTADQFRMNTPPSNPTSWTDLGMRLVDHTPTVAWSGQSDAESDTIDVYIYVGTTSTPTTEEGHSTGGTLDLGTNVTLSDGITYYYRLRSYDGYEWNASYTTSDEFKMNSLPTAPVVDTTPDLPRTDNDLICSIITGSTDPDGDSITYLYQWHKNSVIQGGENENTLSSSLTAKGDNWLCAVTPYDGYENGPSDNDSVVIQNTAPVAKISSPSEGSTFNAGQNIYFISGSTDLDNDTLSHKWFFGDGYSSTEKNPVHSYGWSGGFSVTLIVGDSVDENTDRIEITVLTTLSPGPPLPPLREFSYTFMSGVEEPIPALVITPFEPKTEFVLDETVYLRVFLEDADTGSPVIDAEVIFWWNNPSTHRTEILPTVELGEGYYSAVVETSKLGLGAWQVGFEAQLSGFRKASNTMMFTIAELAPPVWESPIVWVGISSLIVVLVFVALWLKGVITRWRLR